MILLLKDFLRFLLKEIYKSFLIEITAVFLRVSNKAQTPPPPLRYRSYFFMLLLSV